MRRTFPKLLRYILSGSVLAAALGLMIPAGATAMTGAGERTLNVLYRFSGVQDDGAKGGANRKHGTVIHCSNAGNTTASLALVLYNHDGQIVKSVKYSIGAWRTKTAATQPSKLYDNDLNLNTPLIYQGLGMVLSSSTNVVCSAQVLDVRSEFPDYLVDLHMNRVQ